MRTALVSLHSHGDRSFLDDNVLAHLAGALRRAGHASALVVAGLDGAAADPTATPAFARLVAALAGHDVIVYERTWTRRIPEALVAALPGAIVVHCAGEHALDDPPGTYVCEPRALPDLVDHLSGQRTALPAGARVRTAAGGWRVGLAPLADRGPEVFAPELHPIVVDAAALPAARVFSIDGNAGCPYQADARDNPRYAGVALPAGVGRGCGFCTTGNHHQARSQAEAIDAVFTQLAYVRREAPAIDRLVLRDQSPLGYLTELLGRCADEGVGHFTLLLQTRADWLLAGERRFGRALDAAARARIRISPFLIGIESFSQAELDRFNKGTTVATNVAAVAALRTWAAHPAFDLAPSSLGYILFSPWTTMDDLRQSFDGIAATRLDELRGKLLHTRVRLYPDTALYHLAAHDGLLDADAGDGPTAAAGRYGYFPDRAWRFRHDDVARFAALAAAASDATGGRDELRLFRLLLDAFAARPAAEVALADVLAAFDAPPPRGPRTAPPSVGGVPDRGPDRAPPGGGSQDALIAPSALVRSTAARRRTVELSLGEGCGAPCAVCAPPGRAADLEAAVRGGAARLVLRGAPRDPVAIAAIVARARRGGAGEIVLASHAGWVRDADDARALAAAGVDVVLVPIVSHAAAVHDRAVGVPGGLVAALVAMRALAAAGVAIELEVPVVAARLQDLPALLALAVRAVPALRAVRFVLPRHRMPAALAPPTLDELGPRLEEALGRAEALGVRAPLDVTAAVPICAVHTQPRAAAALRFDPRRATAVAGCHHDGPCERCAVAAQCPGVAASYRHAHGTRQVRALAERPAALYAQRTTPRRVWDDRARAAAREVSLLVLRPTVHCNQDCSFCSANESTPNVWADPAQMKRAIARAARRGVERVSFSGGEPTLARELPAYVEVARRAGVRKIELVTNGVLLDRAPRVAELVRAGLTHAFVSLHGHDEAVSSAVTRKVGDFARTVAAIGHLADAGVLTVVNHVVSARNHAFLTRFVEEIHARFGGRVMISFAFVTPQFRALENIALVPRLSDVMPDLLAAAWRALALGQPFVIGSRQGVPPCFLGPFAAWSDLMQLAHEAQAEDAPQKQQGPRCGDCRYARHCTGLWKPYVARFGTDELVPVAGAPLGAAERDVLLTHARRPPWGQPASFDEVHPLLRDPIGEAAGPPRVARDRATDRVAPGSDAREVGAREVGAREVGAREVAERVVEVRRPLRLLMVGSGRRARQLARGALAAGGFAFTGVCSPHADHADRAAFEGCPAFTDLGDALERTRPDAVVIASATPSHAAAAEAALAAGLPVLLEKPIATSEAEAARLAALAAAHAGAALVPAHQDRFAPGLDRFFPAAAGRALAIVRKTPLDAPDVPLLWSRPALYESLYHLLVLAHHHAGESGGALQVDRLEQAGEARLERLHVALSAPGSAPIAITWELAATSDALALTAGAIGWRRIGRDVTLDLGAGAQPVAPRGSDVEAMFAAFRALVRDGAAPPVAAADGVEVMRATRLVLDAMEAAGAPFSRPTAPRHAASPSLSRRYR